MQILKKWLRVAANVHLIPILCLFTFSVGCSIIFPKPKRVAVDPGWQSVEALSKKSHLTGFAFEILSDASKSENIDLERVVAAGQTLIFDLKSGNYDAAFSALPETEKNRTFFAFSRPLLEVGPVLVVPTSSNISDIADVGGKIVGVEEEASAILAVQKTPGITLDRYTEIAKAFEDLSQGKIDALVVDRLVADAYCESLYQGQLKVVGSPLNEEAIRFISLLKNKDLVEVFDKALHKMEISGDFKRLKAKWGL